MLGLGCWMLTTKHAKCKNTKAKSDRNELGLNGGVFEVPIQKYRITICNLQDQSVLIQL